MREEARTGVLPAHYTLEAGLTAVRRRLYRMPAPREGRPMRWVSIEAPRIVGPPSDCTDGAGRSCASGLVRRVAHRPSSRTSRPQCPVNSTRARPSCREDGFRSALLFVYGHYKRLNDCPQRNRIAPAPPRPGVYGPRERTDSLGLGRTLTARRARSGPGATRASGGASPLVKDAQAWLLSRSKPRASYGVCARTR